MMQVRCGAGIIYRELKKGKESQILQKCIPSTNPLGVLFIFSICRSQLAVDELCIGNYKTCHHLPAAECLLPVSLSPVFISLAGDSRVGCCTNLV